MSVNGLLHLDRRARVALMGTLALFVALVATAFAIGGSGSNGTEGAGATSAADERANGLGVADGGVPLAAAAPPVVARHGSVTEFSATGATGSSSGSGATSGGGSADVPQPQTATAPNSPAATDASASVEATKIVRNGELTIRVAKTEVQSKVGELTTLATTEGGYVSSSSTNSGGGEQSGEVVLRIPAAHFTDAITKAETYGKELSLTTSADDVTGRYVDLAAREHALVQTRETYLTILGRARTIGATLEVQDRIQGVQSQIEQLQGQLKVLGNQAAYSTLTVDVTPVALVTPVHHTRHGLSKAWHRSWNRFDHGIDAIVGAIGPIVLALLIMAAVGVVLTIGYRGVRKATS